MVSPEWTGTTVERPSGWGRKWWIPLTRSSSKPIPFKIDNSFLPVRLGTEIMPQLKCVAPRQNQAVRAFLPEPQDKAQWLRGCVPLGGPAILPACGSLVMRELKPQSILRNLFQQLRQIGVS